MSANSDQHRETSLHPNKSHKKPQKKQERAKKASGVHPLKRQMDGSAVQSPPHDPVNSEETLRRNKVGNS